MDVKAINQLLAEGSIDRDDMWPRIVEMESKAHQFRFEFGLTELPTKPGLLIIRVFYPDRTRLGFGRNRFDRKKQIVPYPVVARHDEQRR